MLNSPFAILGALLSTGGNIDYVLGTVKGRVRPNVVTWSLWSLPPLIGLMCQIRAGAGPEMMLTVALAAGPLAVVAASFASGHVRRCPVTRLDRSCAVLSLAAIAIWMKTGDATAALALAIITDLVAAVPTMVKTYREPHSESRKAFMLFAAGGVVTMLAIKEWNLVSWGYPIYVLALSMAILALTVLPRRQGGHVLTRVAS